MSNIHFELSCVDIEQTCIGSLITFNSNFSFQHKLYSKNNKKKTKNNSSKRFSHSVMLFCYIKQKIWTKIQINDFICDKSMFSKGERWKENISDKRYPGHKQINHIFFSFRFVLDFCWSRLVFFFVETTSKCKTSKIDWFLYWFCLYVNRSRIEIIFSVIWFVDQ